MLPRCSATLKVSCTTPATTADALDSGRTGAAASGGRMEGLNRRTARRHGLARLAPASAATGRRARGPAGQISMGGATALRTAAARADVAAVSARERIFCSGARPCRRVSGSSSTTMDMPKAAVHDVDAFHAPGAGDSVSCLARADLHARRHRWYPSTADPDHARNGGRPDFGGQCISPGQDCRGPARNSGSAKRRTDTATPTEK